jgi:broad specificity phosphatase PhoE
MLNAMNKTLLYLVRHGQSTFNVQNRIQGKAIDATNTLSELGRQQAENRSKSLQSVSFDTCFSSPITRCKQTTEILLSSRGLQPIFLEALKEKEQGIVVGRTRQELFAQYPSWKDLTEDERLDTKPIPGEESQRELRDRAFEVIKKIAAESPDKTILIVTHGGFMRSLYTFLAHKSLLDMWHFENCGYMVLEYAKKNFSVIETVGLSLKTVKDLI